MEYYRRSGRDVWDFIREQNLNFHLGNAIKYICRYGYKGDYNDQLSDLNKAIHYLENERNHLQHSRNREDLPRHNTSNPIVFTGSGVQGGVSTLEQQGFDSPYTPEGLNCGGVKGVFGCGGDVISFEPPVSTGMSKGIS